VSGRSERRKSKLLAQNILSETAKAERSRKAIGKAFKSKRDSRVKGLGYKERTSPSLYIYSPWKNS